MLSQACSVFVYKTNTSSHPVLCGVHHVNQQVRRKYLLCAGAETQGHISFRTQPYGQVAEVPAVRAARRTALGTQAGAHGGLPGGSVEPGKQEGRSESLLSCLGVGSGMPLLFLLNWFHFYLEPLSYRAGGKPDLSRFMSFVSFLDPVKGLSSYSESDARLGWRCCSARHLYTETLAFLPSCLYAAYFH